MISPSKLLILLLQIIDISQLLCLALQIVDITHQIHPPRPHELFIPLYCIVDKLEGILGIHYYGTPNYV